MKLLKIFSAASSAVEQKSIPVEIGDLFQYSIHIEFTGDEAGTLVLQASNIGGSDDVNWIIVPNSSVAVTAGENHMWNITGGSYRFIRAVWTPDSGSGTITGHVVLKEPINRY